MVKEPLLKGQEISNSGLKKLVSRIGEKIDLNRVANDSDLGPIETALLRGENRALKWLMGELQPKQIDVREPEIF